MLDIAKDKKLEFISLKLIFGQNKHKLNTKDEFADGLHLIDLEKLKIENQNLNEKIEDRNEEIFKLQKKNHKNIQLISHMTEKLDQEIIYNKKLNREFTELDTHFRSKKEK